MRGRAAHNSDGRKQERDSRGRRTRGGWRCTTRPRDTGGEGSAGGGRTEQREDAHTCARSKGPVSRIIPAASVYRSEARANQTDIIDLTCDLEIRKITDGERLEPIIIVNIGRPSPYSSPPRSWLSLFLSWSAIYPSSPGDRTAGNFSLRFLSPSSPSLLWSLSSYMCLPFLPPPFTPYPCARPPPRFLLPSSGISRRCARRPFSVQSFYLY